MRVQGAVSELRGSAEAHFAGPDAPPSVRADLALQTALRYLDNSSSVWELLLAPWRVDVAYSFSAPDFDGALTATTEQTVSVSSAQHAILHVNQASLLMAGDVAAFGAALLAPPDAAAAAAAAAAPRGAAPPMAEQMGLSCALTERLPQRYYVQNHLGVRLWYWAGAEGKRHELPAGRSEQLRCKPPTQSIVIEASDGGKVRWCCDMP